MFYQKNFFYTRKLYLQHLIPVFQIQNNLRELRAHLYTNSKGHFVQKKVVIPGFKDICYTNNNQTHILYGKFS